MLKSNFCLSVKHTIKLTNANRSHRSTLELLVISDFQGASHLSSIQQAPCEGSKTVHANGFWDDCIMALSAGLIASANRSTPMLPKTICVLDASSDSQMSIVACFVYRFHSLAAPQGEAPLVQPLSLRATSISDLWMQGSLLASMQTCTHPAMPSATFHNHNILVFS